MNPLKDKLWNADNVNRVWLSVIDTECLRYMHLHDGMNWVLLSKTEAVSYEYVL